MPEQHLELEADGKVVTISRPDKVFFPATGATKGDLARYYLAVAPALLDWVGERPCVLKRYPDGALGSSFYQKRVPASRPEWLETVVVRFPSGRSAEELCLMDAAHVLWAVNLGCIELHPWAVRRRDLDHPDELRIDLDPHEGVSFDAVREVALAVREHLDRHGMSGVPKTSGSRGLHVFVPIEARWTFSEVRRAALALGREVERALPDLVTTAWWRNERGAKVFIDYNQNARDRTIASAYSVRPTREGRVSCPLAWEEVDSVDPTALTLTTVPQRDPIPAPDELAGAPYSLQSLLEQAAADEAGGLGDAPWPPYTPTKRGGVD